MAFESTNGAEVKPAGWRLYIPRKGYYAVDFPSMPAAKYQLSVAPHPIFPELDVKKFVPLGLPMDTTDANDLQVTWSLLFRSRLHQERPDIKISHETTSFRDDSALFKPDILSLSFFAPTTEKLFKTAVVPAVQKHCVQNGKHLAVDYVSYLFPFWSEKELKPVQIYEGELSKFIREGGKLPENIGAVYIDFPPNQQFRDNMYSKDQLVKFIKKNRGILFIIDQANLYFKEVGLNINDDLVFDSLLNKTENISEDDLVLVTNTTTKSLGSAGCAFGSATKEAKKLFNSTPALVDFNQDLYKKALQSLYLEIPKSMLFAQFHSDDVIHSYEFRQTIAQNRKKLAALLQELFGGAAISPELVVGGARIIINAQEIKNVDGLGFKNAGELCRYLYHKFSIATKPATVYASREKWGDDKYGKYVHMTIPWTEETMIAVLQAFKDLRNRKNNSFKS